MHEKKTYKSCFKKIKIVKKKQKKLYYDCICINWKINYNLAKTFSWGDANMYPDTHLLAILYSVVAVSLKPHNTNRIKQNTTRNSL